MQKGYLKDGVSQTIVGKVLTEIDIDTDTSLGTSNELIPSQNAVKEYVDENAGAAPDASTTVKGISKLSVAPASPTNPIAVGDNDPRLITINKIMAIAAAKR